MKEGFHIYDNKAELMSSLEQLITPLEAEDSKVKRVIRKHCTLDVRISWQDQGTEN